MLRRIWEIIIITIIINYVIIITIFHTIIFYSLVKYLSDQADIVDTTRDHI